MAEITIREARVEDAAGIARVHVDSWCITYRGIVPDQVLANLSYEQREQSWAKGIRDTAASIFYYVAVTEAGDVVGFVNGGKPPEHRLEGFDGKLYAIYILEAFQGHGIGRKLVQALVGSMVQKGLTSMYLWVFEKNTPARHFYEAMGGQIVGSKPLEIGGVTLEELAYGWKDIRTIP